MHLSPEQYQRAGVENFSGKPYPTRRKIRRELLLVSKAYFPLPMSNQMPKKLELHEGDAALDRFSKPLKSIFSIPRKDAERIRRSAKTPRAMKVAQSVPGTATVAVPSIYSSARRRVSANFDNTSKIRAFGSVRIFGDDAKGLSFGTGRDLNDRVVTERKRAGREVGHYLP